MKIRLICVLMACLVATLTSGCEERHPGGLSSAPPDSSSASSQSAGQVPSSSEPEAESRPVRLISKENVDYERIGALDAKQVLWGPGTLKGEDKRPIAPVQLQKQYGDYDADFIGPAKGNVYLTFDEGYENGYTPAILDTLKEKGVRAVFFVTMHYAKSAPELVRRMIDEGHIVGNHSANHPNYTAISLEKATEETFLLHDYVKENFDYDMYLFRPPEGAFSEQSLSLLQAFGYRTVLWSFAYKDWDPDAQMGYDAAYEKVTQNIHDGAIMLFHAVGVDNSQILGPVIDYIRAQGFTLSAYDLGD